MLAVRFVQPETSERVMRDSPLEVVLVNARSEERPERAQAIAQANLAGGGNVERGRASSPLPPSLQAHDSDALDTDEQQIEAMKAQQERLLAQLRRELASIPVPDPRNASDAQQIQREQRRQALIRTLAEIEKRINEENARPRKRFISPSTREAVYAAYYDTLRRRIEDHGTANFPESGGRKLYGELTMIITVNHDGRVLGTEIVQSSGQSLLDARAAAIVRSLTFGRFSPEMLRQADQIVVVSRFRFARDESLQTQVQSAP